MNPDKISQTNHLETDFEAGLPQHPRFSSTDNTKDIVHPKKKKPQPSCFKRFFNYMFPQRQTVTRKILFSGEVSPPNYFENKVVNTKYSIISFVPVVLYNQFKFFFNMFYLLLAVSQFFDPLKVGLLFTYVAPLAFVLLLTMLKEAYDDLKRYWKDKEANSTNYRKLTQTGLVPTPSAQLKVGDIIEITANQRVPADLLLLYTTDPTGNIFIRTDQLDGETDWKLRKPIIFTQKYLSNSPAPSLLSLPCSIKVSPPIENIYKFEGVFTGRKSLQDQKEKEGLSLENTLWANTVLTAGKILAIVLYTGKETRSALNSEAPRTKIGKLDKELNLLSKLLFVIMVIISIILVIFAAGNLNFSRLATQTFRYIILLSSIIPISMRVNLDFAKIFYCFQINRDKEIEGSIARNSVIPEELGRIEFLLTDKTGTLTQNDMIFKKISLENMRYSYEDVDKITKILAKSCRAQYEKSKKNAIELSQPNSNKEESQRNNTEILSSRNSEQSFSLEPKKGLKKDKNLSLMNMIKAIALCHNVTPIYEDNFSDNIEKNLEENNENHKESLCINNDFNEIQIPLLSQRKDFPEIEEINKKSPKKTFQASSPDEVSLVKTAESMGFELVERSQTKIKIVNAGGYEENYEILGNFPFSSETKRMGIILKNLETQSIVFYLKGADVVMKNLIPAVKRGFLLDECDNLAKEGLRTLVITQKCLSLEEYETWRLEYEAAQTTLNNREQNVRKVIEKLEENMEFLGITGVEDKLQEDVCATLENLRSAGIHIWMLTGDKMETAQCVAISAGLRSVQQEVFIIKEQETQEGLKELLEQYEQNFKNNSNIVIVIDGTSLKTAFEYNTKKFFEITSKAPAVICCRCSPTQKSLITEGIKIFCKKQTAAVGDGGNDVGMIQKAHVGIGIKGKEGMQAALASDFSIEKFKYLNKLLLWHGRLSYKRSANLSQFVIHRGLIISIIQAVFMALFYFVPISVYSGMLLLGYSTVFTILPVFSLIFDQDIDVKNALKYPPLYKTLQKGRELNIKTFLIWLWASVFQGVMIIVISLYVFSRAFLDIVTITFTTLILTEFCNIYSSLNKMHIAMLFSQIFSVILYFCTILLMKNIFMVSTLTWAFVLKILLLTFITWFPLHLIKMIKKYCDPSDYQKLMMSNIHQNSILVSIV